MARVTVVIPTTGRSHFLNLTLEGLCSQAFKDFEVLLILKAPNANTLATVQKFSKLLKIKILLQKSNSLLGAYNEGINNATGEIIAFIDDDAVPESNWLSEHVLSYEIADVSGVTGDVVPTHTKNNILFQSEAASEILRFFNQPKLIATIGAKLWNRSLKGQENYLVYISKGGYSQKQSLAACAKKVNSLLYMATNMSIRKTALKDFLIPTSFTKLGIGFEQVISWHIWKNGQRTIFNPYTKVHHIIHGQTMSRFLKSKAISQAYAEEELLFYYLFSREKQLSIMHRIVSLAHRIMVHIRKFKGNWKKEWYVMSGIFVGNLLGLTWLISQKNHGSFIPTQSIFLR